MNYSLRFDKHQFSESTTHPLLRQPPDYINRGRPKLNNYSSICLLQVCYPHLLHSISSAHPPYFYSQHTIVSFGKSFQCNYTNYSFHGNNSQFLIIDLCLWPFLLKIVNQKLNNEEKLISWSNWFNAHSRFFSFLVLDYSCLFHHHITLNSIDRVSDLRR